MTTNTSTGVDLDQVLVVADDLRRICHRPIWFGVPISTRPTLPGGVSHGANFVGRVPSSGGRASPWLID